MFFGHSLSRKNLEQLLLRFLLSHSDLCNFSIDLSVKPIHIAKMRDWHPVLQVSFAAVFLAFQAFNAGATTYYVDINNPNPAPPYTSWATAATNIQDAVNAAVNGNLIMVNPGVYQSGGETVNGYNLTNRVAITGPLIVESTEGPTNTIIQGYQIPGASNGSNAVRCVYIHDEQCRADRVYLERRGDIGIG